MKLSGKEVFLKERLVKGFGIGNSEVDERHESNAGVDLLLSCLLI